LPVTALNRTWADDLRRLCDALGLARPVVLGSSFGGHVVLTYAGLFPGHPGGIILANTTGGRSDYQRSVEPFRRLGGDEAAAIAQRDFADPTRDKQLDGPARLRGSRTRLGSPVGSSCPGIWPWQKARDRIIVIPEYFEALLAKNIPG
jgi:pimeloyl-ACP methyl ester carboxylesterase